MTQLRQFICIFTTLVSNEMKSEKLVYGGLSHQIHPKIPLTTHDIVFTHVLSISTIAKRV
jgi:hypothetical protein